MLWLTVDRSSATPLIRQVYDQVRMHILRGELQAGERLPSSRELASDLHISRIVILEAYDQLLAEGYIESHQGSGTYVAQGTYLEEVGVQHQSASHELIGSKKEVNNIIDFRSGIPALGLFPRKIWARLAQRVYSETPHAAFGYDNPEGRPELRTTLARYLLKTRGVHSHPDQIIITSGAAQAFSLVAKLLLSPGDEVIIEDPVMYDVQAILSSSGASLYPIPVDGHGIQADLIPEDKRPRLIFVTPSHQFPLGGILPIQRRIQLIQFARMSGCYIVEDDYDSEFRYGGPPISSLQELETDRVIYVGTFSKILSPALRLGYMVLPPSLIDRCRSLKHLADLHSPSLEQLILARFIEEGHLERHIMHARKIYRKRRTAVINALTMHFPDQIYIHGDATGLHLVAEFPGNEFTEKTLEHLLLARVRIYPVELHAIRKGYHPHKVILGYGNLTSEEIEEGVKSIKSVLGQRVLFPTNIPQ